MQHLFIDSTKQLSRKEYELRDSAARSHAATVAHQRAREQAKARPKLRRGSSSASQRTFVKPINSNVLHGSEATWDASLEQHGLGDIDVGPDGDPSTNANQSMTEVMLLPQSILIRGQSDPFDTLPVQIDPKTHELLMHYRETHFYARYGVNAKTWTSSETAMADWRDTKETLADSGRGYAFLAQLSASLALKTSSKPLVKSSLAYVRRSTVALRSRLASKEDGFDSPQVWRHVSLLQNAELLVRNRDAAVIHGKMLRYLFDHLTALGKTIDMRLLLHAIYVDVHVAMTFLVRPNFEPSAKLLEEFPEIRSVLLEEVSVVSTNSIKRLDNQILGMNLQNIFLGWEQCRVVKNFYGRRLWTFMTQLRTINHLLDTEDILNRLFDSPDTTIFHAEAYLTLAALYFIRITTLPEHFVSKDLFVAHANMLRRLRYHLEVSDIVEDKQLYSRARFWALFVGAHSEHQAAVVNRSLPASVSSGWFNVQLAQQAKRCGLLDWNSAKAVLESFMYCDITPDPSIWYTALLYWVMMLM